MKRGKKTVVIGTYREVAEYAVPDDAAIEFPSDAADLLISSATGEFLLASDGSLFVYVKGPVTRTVVASYPEEES